MTNTTKAKKATRNTQKTRSTNRLEVFYKKYADTLPTDTWVVFTNEDGKRKRPRQFKGFHTRDNVRSAYAQTFGVPFTETRSRRVSNY